MRYFPTSFDAVYQTNAEIVNPDGNKQPILARGTLGNNGFHINFSISNYSVKLSYLGQFLNFSISNSFIYFP